jgi:Tol biopolymer transport system component
MTWKNNETVPLAGVNTEYEEQMPAISGDGRWIAFVTNRPLEPGGFNSPSRLLLYDREKQLLVPTPGLTPGHCRDKEPSFSSDGRYLAFASDRPGPDDEHGAGDIYLYDLREQKLVPLPGLNSAGHDCQPSISRGGRFIVFTSERFPSEQVHAPGQRDIFLYDRRAAALLPTPDINTPGEEFEPSIAVLDPALET